MIASRAGRRGPRLLTLGAVVVTAGGVGTIAAAAASHDAGPELRAEHRQVPPGGTLVLHGEHFPPRAHITLRVGRVRHRAAVVGAARTGLRGGFVAPITIEKGAHRGRYVAVACHDRCRVSARLRFRIARR